MKDELPLEEEPKVEPALLSRAQKAKNKRNQKQSGMNSKFMSNTTVEYSSGPFFIQKKKFKEPKEDILKDTAFDLVRFNPNPAAVRDISNKILDLGKQQLPSLQHIDPLKIVYANIQSNISGARERILEMVKSGNPPDIIVLHEVPLNSSIRFPEYRSFRGADGQKTINILTARDLGPTLNVVNNKGFPTILMKDHKIILMHTLILYDQHINFPLPESNTIIGDFNLRSNPKNWNTFDSFKFKALEPRGCVGIASTVPFNVEWKTIPKTDHYLAEILLDVQRPPPYSLVNKEYVDSLMESNFLNAEVRKIPQKELNKSKARYPVKMSIGYKHLWQFREFDINLKASKFVSFPLLDQKIKDQIPPLYLGSFRRTDRIIDDRGEQILRVFIREFFQDAMMHHYHSKARDFNGFSYNKLVKLMFSRKNTDYWAKCFRNYWNNLKYVRTRMITLKKKRAITSVRDVRFIAVQDFLMKIFEEICRPMINLVRWITLNLAAGQFGFQKGISCFDLISTLIKNDVPAPPTMNLQALIPDFRLWQPSWKEI